MPTAGLGRDLGASYVPGIETEPFIRTIEWEMMDKSKFLSLNVTSSFIVRTFLYPFTVIKTRLQIQRGTENYKGTFDAFRKIGKYEGLSGFYKGFWVNSFTIISGSCYVVTYENVRHFLQANDVTNSKVKALIGGACASLVGQTIIVPVDVVSQHLMMMGQGQFNNTKSGKNVLSAPSNLLHIETEGKTKLDVTRAIIQEIYKTDGLRGFYRGYVASLCTYVPNSALWWTFYHFYQDQLYKILPSGFSQLVQSCAAAMLGGLTTTVLINPIDIVRARVQVQRLDSIPQTFAILWSEERLGMFKKGLTARMVSSLVFSFGIILGYESIKRLSVQERYKSQIRW